MDGAAEVDCVAAAGAAPAAGLTAETGGADAAAEVGCVAATGAAAATGAVEEAG